MYVYGLSLLLLMIRNYIPIVVYSWRVFMIQQSPKQIRLEKKYISSSFWWCFLSHFHWWPTTCSLVAEKQFRFSQFFFVCLSFLIFLANGFSCYIPAQRKKPMCVCCSINKNIPVGEKRFICNQKKEILTWGNDFPTSKGTKVHTYTEIEKCTGEREATGVSEFLPLPRLCRFINASELPCVCGKRVDIWGSVNAKRPIVQ